MKTSSALARTTGWLVALGILAAMPPAGWAGSPPVNTFLSSPLYGITHFDSAQTDSTPYGPPPGNFIINPAKQPLVYGGPVNIMTLAATDPDYMWSVGTDHVAYVLKASGKWEEVARREAPQYVDPSLGPVSPATLKAFGNSTAVGMNVDTMNTLLAKNFGAKYQYRILNGGYSVADKNNVLYANFGHGIYAFALKDGRAPVKGIQIIRNIENVDVITGVANTVIVGLSMTYDGHLVIVFRSGLAVIDRSLDPKTAHYYAFNNNERVSNSIAVDENGGLYIATTKTMYKLVWIAATGAISDKESDGAWSSPYDAPDDMPPVIKLDTGTGSTPTLMGFGSDLDKLVVITDGAKRMNLVAFWRDSIPPNFVQQPGTASRRIANQIPVDCGFKTPPEWIQSDQSVVVNGYGAFVVNNIPQDTTVLQTVSTNKILVVSLMGPAYPTARGVQRFGWDTGTHSWKTVWSNANVSSTSMVPVHTQALGMVLVSGYDTAKAGWQVVGMDWSSGVIVHTTTFDKANFGNGAYALLEYLDNGDMLYNSIAGIMRVHYPLK